MPMKPSSYSDESVKCYGSVGVNGFDEVILDNLEATFELSRNYEEVYIVKDSSQYQEFLHDKDLTKSYGLKLYKSWIYDGNEDRVTVGRKYIQMYPYIPPYLEIGDYVSWDYHKNGVKSTWLVTALDSSTIEEQIGSIRLCTNEMRFYNEDGKLLRVPCVFDDSINSEKNISLSTMKYINGITTVYAQMNPDSNQIRENQRFLFGRPGNWTAFRVTSVGVNNFMNDVFWDNSTARLLEITLEGSYVNDLSDDVVNGIADAIKYNIEITPGSVENVVGSEVQLTASVYKNGEVSDSGVVWTSSDENIATVSASGLVTLVSPGAAVIKATSEIIDTVFSEINVTVGSSASDSFEVVVEPYGEDSYGILQGTTQVFSCYLHKNGIPETIGFTFDYDPDSFDGYAKFKEIDQNHFSVQNIRMYTGGALHIICKTVDGLYQKDISILLKGAW